jgi:hypothetical protein
MAWDYSIEIDDNTFFLTWYTHGIYLVYSTVCVYSTWYIIVHGAIYHVYTTRYIPLSMFIPGIYMVYTM